MNRYFYPVKVVLLGLLISQILAFIQVYQSNTDLYEQLTAMKEAGYLIVPNEKVRPSLMEYGTAFLGGLFFTLTVGAGLTLLTFAAVWFRGRLFPRNRLVFILYLLLWFISLAGVNWGGFSLMATSYFLIVPLVVFVAAGRWLPARAEKEGWLFSIFHLTVFLVLALLWIPQMKAHRIIDIRDKMLLTNSAGRAVTDFYYRYTLYAAEAFKPLEMKSLKTSNLSGIKNRPLQGKLAGMLLRFDYLPVSGEKEADLEVLEEDDRLVFRHRGERILETTGEKFLTNPGELLREFSQKSDRYGTFRLFTLYTIALALPLTFYLLLYALFYLLFLKFLLAKKASFLAAVLCFTVGVGLLASLRYAQSEEITAGNVAQALASESWQERVGGLKFLSNQGHGLGDLSLAKKMVSSPHIAERYWLARVLGNNRQPESYQILLKLLDDPQRNVACMAFEALGRRGDARAVPVILPRLVAADSWYKQMYAYRALRWLGWTQASRR